MDPSDIDYRLFRLMELGYSLHDCHYANRDIVVESLDPVFPMIRRAGKEAKMGAEDVASWERFHDIMTTTPSFRFPGDQTSVPNPLNGRGFMNTKTFQYQDGSQISAEFDRYLESSTLDVWSQGGICADHRARADRAACAAQSAQNSAATRCAVTTSRSCRTRTTSSSA